MLISTAEDGLGIIDELMKIVDNFNSNNGDNALFGRYVTFSTTTKKDSIKHGGRMKFLSKKD